MSKQGDQETKKSTEKKTEQHEPQNFRLSKQMNTDGCHGYTNIYIYLTNFTTGNQIFDIFQIFFLFGVITIVT